MATRLTGMLLFLKSTRLLPRLCTSSAKATHEVMSSGAPCSGAVLVLRRRQHMLQSAYKSACRGALLFAGSAPLRRTRSGLAAASSFNPGWFALILSSACLCSWRLLVAGNRPAEGPMRALRCLPLALCCILVAVGHSAASAEDETRRMVPGTPRTYAWRLQVSSARSVRTRCSISICSLDMLWWHATAIARVC